ncbi:methionine/alanine import family NSS transporter small subunit [Bacillus sp. ISL-41]|jgi:hypothetical protein|uniref:Methionine/alanine import family NSS transporter small subunit n=1 Tax=Mesobacillus selenatarsenatis TaxID=388741 RepID=A0A846TNH1_9BACI|nr:MULTISPECIES: methionine/alanine import family NSS transporter small subunit [Bacillaceae]MBT2643331.1 methionine/alanine import family NSS transporter small subunit [Bacillus sp. ISL-41]NKE07192.1 methionine/alanine import family NSS transporter small subunit [Mesobacillus selenatarsenatis]
MDASAVAMMVTGMVIIWGGLAASVLYAVKKARS